MSETLVWWIMVQVVGLAALPLCLTLFRRLPDRGYALSKPFALLLVGYLFWILVIAGLPNATRTITAVLVLFFLASGYLLWRRRDELLAFARERWWLIAATEALFFLAFITAAYLRSYVPDITGTEKPMDFMFLNAVTNADGFPPEDPWLAGENVAYYYFGYLLVSIMSRLSDVFAGVPTSVGYNLGLAMIVALAATGAFGLVYNLTAPREERAAEAGPGTPAAGFSSRPLWRPMAFGLVAALLLAVMGNLEGVLEWLAAHGFGSNGFWSWVGINNLQGYESANWYPDQYWFWWRATRIVEAVPGTFGIHEFPFFSFLLGDMHPHVMSIPFVLLAAGAGLALLRSEGPLDLVVWLERPLWLAAFAVILGGLAFLNTWDMPTMAFVIILVTVLRNRLLTDRWSWGLALDSIGFVVPLLLAAMLAYVPFYFGGFDSQAAGFTAEAGKGTRLFHTFLIWGPFAALVLPYAAWRLSRNGGRVTLPAVLWSLAPAIAVVLLWVVWDLLAKAFGWLPPGVRPNPLGEVDPFVWSDLWSSGFWSGLWTRISEREWNWLTVLVLGGALGLLLLALAREVEGAKSSVEERLGHVFALTLSAIGVLLILGAELFFIRDFFNSRMNTIFKLYYQSWLLLSIAGGFVLYELARGWRPPAIALTWRAVWAGGAAVVLLAAFVYPLLAAFERTNAFDLPRGLDGLAYLLRDNRDQYDAIQWLLEQDGHPVVAEAIGTPYDTRTSRVSGATGLPTILGWPQHEGQWRGGYDEQEGRPEALERLYTSSDPEEVMSVIQDFDIRYVFVGPVEQEKYPGLTLPAMSDVIEPVPAFQQGEVAIYRVRPGILSRVTGTSR